MNLIIYEKSPIYLIIHVALGTISVFYTPVLWIFLGYQFLQLVLNKRFFLFELRVKDGNSLEHTVVKVVEFFVGFFIGTILKYNKFHLRI